MFAIIVCAGQQYRVSLDTTFVVNKLFGNFRNVIYIHNIIMFVDNKNFIFYGNPYVSNLCIKCLIVDHYLGNKKLIFKKNRRKHYVRYTSYRQMLTKIKVLNFCVKNDIH